MGTSGIVRKIIPFSAVDGPGNRTGIFLQGCNFRCKYCHNPETIAQGMCPEARRMSPAEVAREVERNMPYIRGVTFSGGECTLQKQFLRESAALLREKGLSVLLDSNGSLDFSKERGLLAQIDGVMLDIKAFDADEHRELTGAENATVLRNALFLAGEGKLAEIRTVIAPSLFSCEQTIRETGRLLARENARSPIRYKLIQYRPHGVRKEFLGTKVPSREVMGRMRDLAESLGFQVVVT